MSKANLYFHMFLYYPSVLLLLYIYIVFIIPLRSRVLRRDYWLFVKTSFERGQIKYIFTRLINRWKGGGSGGGIHR
uniref:Uncharacterized protein n=1 Tax=Lindsaea linearis TaxID=641179 RepID=A0A5B9RLA6_9MONI|nr:hypothetical protein [Lindsaea linearis]QEG57327.1 hypothetical protein [Lindsaea linearis]